MNIFENATVTYPKLYSESTSRCFPTESRRLPAPVRKHVAGKRIVNNSRKEHIRVLQPHQTDFEPNDLGGADYAVSARSIRPVRQAVPHLKR